MKISRRNLFGLFVGATATAAISDTVLAKSELPIIMVKDLALSIMNPEGKTVCGFSIDGDFLKNGKDAIFIEKDYSTLPSTAIFTGGFSIVGRGL